MDKTFTIAGVSTLNGVRTYRFSNIKLNLRVNMLRFEGHTDIDLIELPRPMDRLHAIAHLISLGKHGVIPTRAADKNRPNELLTEAEKLVAKREKTKATRLAKQAEAEKIARAEARAAKKAARDAAVAA